MIKRLNSNAWHQNYLPASKDNLQIVNVDTKEDLKEAVVQLTKSFAFYLQKNEQTQLTGMCIASENKLYQINLTDANDTPQRDLFSPEIKPKFKHDFLKLLGPLFADKKRIKVGHDIKASIHLLAQEGIILEKPFEDIMLMSYDLDGSKHAHDLDTLISIYFPNQETQGKEAFFIAEIARQIKEKLIQQNELELYEDIDAPLISILADMEKQGILVDVNHLEKLNNVFNRQLEELTQQIHALTGEEVNINSPSQLGVVLFEKRG